MSPQSGWASLNVHELFSWNEKKKEKKCIFSPHIGDIYKIFIIRNQELHFQLCMHSCYVCTKTHFTLRIISVKPWGGGGSLGWGVSKILAATEFSKPTGWKKRLTVSEWRSPESLLGTPPLPLWLSCPTPSNKIIQGKAHTAILWQKEAILENYISHRWAKCICHLIWHQCNIIMSWLKYLSAGWVFLLQTRIQSTI